jgi:hypothetical protein
MTLLTSKVTWAFIGLFVIGGLERIGWLPTGVGDILITALGIGGLVVHDTQIKTGKVA